jgi:hypothetical protein
VGNENLEENPISCRKCRDERDRTIQSNSNKEAPKVSISETLVKSRLLG